jgi:hypothetical protein
MNRYEGNQFAASRDTKDAYHFRSTCIISVLQQFPKNGTPGWIISTYVFEGCCQALNLTIFTDRPKRHNLEDVMALWNQTVVERFEFG